MVTIKPTLRIERLFLGGVLHNQFRALPEEWIVVEHPTRGEVTSEENSQISIGCNVKVHRYLLHSFEEPVGDGVYHHKAFVIDTMTKEDAEKEFHNVRQRFTP